MHECILVPGQSNQKPIPSTLDTFKIRFSVIGFCADGNLFEQSLALSLSLSLLLSLRLMKIHFGSDSEWPKKPFTLSDHIAPLHAVEVQEQRTLRNRNKAFN